MLLLPVPPGRGVQDRDISWVLVQTHRHPVQFFQPSLAGRLSSILPPGSAVIPENALEQVWGRSCPQDALGCHYAAGSGRGAGRVRSDGEERIIPFP